MNVVVVSHTLQEEKKNVSLFLKGEPESDLPSSSSLSLPDSTGHLIRSTTPPILLLLLVLLLPLSSSVIYVLKTIDASVAQ